MFGWKLTFDSPVFLALLPLLLVPMGFWSYRSLSGLGYVRRIMALLMRAAVLALIILALANTQVLRQGDRMTVIYLLDQSASIPQSQRESMMRYVEADVEKHRRDFRRDRASVIVFGGQANIEVPPLDDDVVLSQQIESSADLQPDATNLEAALKLAQATFPEDSARRLVLVTDGNENVGDVRTMARRLASDGVGMDVIPVRIPAVSEIAVERLALPSDIRKGQPFKARVVLRNLAEADGGDRSASVPGKLQLRRRRGGSVETLSEQRIVVDPGKTVLEFQHEIDGPDFYQYEAIFVPEDPAADRTSQNNRATAFTHVQGRGHVLMIEDWENRDPTGHGEFHELVDRLRQLDIQVTVQFTDNLFTSLAQLQRFDSVVLANVARSSGDTASNLTHFSDQQIQMLVRNTQQMGCGLVMLGGPHSFGAGGWNNTELEKAMPVDFQIHNAKVKAVGALAMVMHASEMAQGNHWQKVIGREALKALGAQDYCGVVHWDNTTMKEGWLWGQPKGMARVGANRQKMLARMNRMTPGDMPEFDPALNLALAAFATVPEAAIKHMIVISDGDPTPPAKSTLRGFKKAGVKISTVAVGTHGPAGSTPLQKIASFTGGKYYVVTDPKALPRIFQREARRVARPLIVEQDLTPIRGSYHEILQGIEKMPPIQGFVMTTVKDNPLVEVGLLSPYPADEKNATLLATWNYGLGRTAVFTSDAGQRWTKAWMAWEGYDQLFSQLVRWSMRPTGNTGHFNVVTDHQEGRVRIVVDALDKDDDFLNFLNIQGAVVGPDMQSRDIPLQQVAPGRYAGGFEADAAGSYFLSILPGTGRAPIRTGVNVPYSPEFSDSETNEAILKTLVELQPVGGQAGQWIQEPLDIPPFTPALGVDTYRHDLPKAVTSNYVWPLLVLTAACLFFADVFNRRVAIGLQWVGPMWATFADYFVRVEDDVEAEQRMERLRSRKAEVTKEIRQRPATARFEPSPDEDASTEILEGDEAAARLTGGLSKKPPSLEDEEGSQPEGEVDDYTARLLKAKKDVWKKK